MFDFLLRIFSAFAELHLTYFDFVFKILRMDAFEKKCELAGENPIIGYFFVAFFSLMLLYGALYHYSEKLGKKVVKYHQVKKYTSKCKGE